MDDKKFLAATGTAFAAFNACFLHDFSFKTFPWETAELIELYEDMYELTGSVHLKYQIIGIINKFLAELGDDWIADNDYYDDIGWILIAVLRGYKISGRADYLKAAQTNFDSLWEKAWDETRECGGAYFCKSKRCKTACSNLPLSIAASMLGESLLNQGYCDKGKKALDWVIAHLYVAKTGQVYDALNFRHSDALDDPDYPEPQLDQSRLTYSHGTLIGAAYAVYKSTGDETYLGYAERTAKYVMTDWFEGEVMDIEFDNRDLVGFKGIFARFLGAYARNSDRPEYTRWLRKNAESAWENRNKYSLMDTRLASVTSDDMTAGTDGRISAFNFSSALSVMIQSAISAKKEGL